MRRLGGTEAYIHLCLARASFRTRVEHRTCKMMDSIGKTSLELCLLCHGEAVAFLIVLVHLLLLLESVAR